jgi:Arc/MetJ-type ribon-helix-helix transcriptional regulator
VKGLFRPHYVTWYEQERIESHAPQYLRNTIILPRKIVAVSRISAYGECMARMISTTIRLNEEDVRALKRARAAGHSASELIRKGLRVVASRYYSGRRPPSTLLFESTDAKLGDESELFQDVED